MHRRLFIPLVAAALGVAAPGKAQMIPWSQYGSVTQRLGDTEIQIRYRRPVARGRELFGGIVNWGEPWTPGADSATTVRFSTDVIVDGTPLPAGTYSIWMIPDPESWTHLAPEPGQHMETLTFHFPRVNGPQATLAFQWGTTMIRIPIEIPEGD
jgi:hypothetical protein